MGQDFAALKSGNAVYLDVMGLWLPRLQASWALPLSLLAFVVIGTCWPGGDGPACGIV